MTVDWKGITNKETEEEAVAFIYELYKKGASSMQIAKALGCTDSTIRNFFKKHGLKSKQHGGLYTGKHCVITQEEYRTKSYRQLAKEKNVSVWTVWNVTKVFRTKKVNRFKEKVSPS